MKLEDGNRTGNTGDDYSIAREWRADSEGELFALEKEYERLKDDFDRGMEELKEMESDSGNFSSKEIGNKKFELDAKTRRILEVVEAIPFTHAKIEYFKKVHEDFTRRLKRFHARSEN